MTRQAVEIDGKTYWLKIGLRGIIYLQSLPEYTEEDMLTAGLITLQNMTIAQAKALSSRISFSYLDADVLPFSQIDVRDLYSKAVGEMNIDPAIFFQMTPEEIDLAYEGYLRRNELQANLNKLAFAQALHGDHSSIRIVDDHEYSVGNEQERRMTFQRLGIDI